MKKIFITVLLSMMSLAWAKADNGILKDIEQRGNSIETLQSDFEQIKTIVANGKKIASKGILYYTDQKLAMYHNAPSKDLLVINGNEMYMIRGAKKNKFNTDNNKTMNSLRNTLLMCISGDLETLAAENGAEISSSDKGSYYEVTLTVKKKTPRGFSSIVLQYDKSTCILYNMVMNEFSGNSTVYKMSGIQKNVSVDEAKFKIA